VFDLCAGGWEKEGADGSGGRGERALPRSQLTLLPFLLPSLLPAAGIVQDLTPIYVRLSMHARKDPEIRNSPPPTSSRSRGFFPLSLYFSRFFENYAKQHARCPRIKDISCAASSVPNGKPSASMNARTSDVHADARARAQEHTHTCTRQHPPRRAATIEGGRGEDARARSLRMDQNGRRDASGLAGQTRRRRGERALDGR